jgi:hypothetical protein
VFRGLSFFRAMDESGGQAPMEISPGASSVSGEKKKKKKKMVFELRVYVSCLTLSLLPLPRVFLFVR